MAETGKVIDNFRVRIKTGLGRFLRIGFEIIDAADAVKQVEPQARVFLQKPADFQQISRGDRQPRIESRQVFGLDAVGEPLFENGDDFSGSHGKSNKRLTFVTPWPARLAPWSLWRKRSA